MNSYRIKRRDFLAIGSVAVGSMSLAAGASMNAPALRTGNWSPWRSAMAAPLRQNVVFAELLAREIGGFEAPEGYLE
jgi:hypothetical protein